MEMLLISSGREAKIYRTGKGNVLWVSNGPDAHPECVTGWLLCRDSLSPPHFPGIFNVTFKNGCLHVEMEYVEGGSPTEWDQEQADAILDELETAGVFHRDIRLPNLIVRETGEWCLIDFGWACSYTDPYPGARRLGGKGRAKSGPDDKHAMDVIKGVLGG